MSKMREDSPVPGRRARDEEDDLLVAAAQRGDAAAFEELYIRYREPIADLGFRYLGNYHDAEELLQEVFLKTFQAIKRYRPRPEARFFSWIYRIGVNCAINHKKEAGRPRPAFLGEAGGQDPPAPLPFQPETRVQDAELEEALARGLAGLSPKQRVVFVLKHVQQMSTAEIAADLKCSEGTVRKQLFRAVVKLRRMMAADLRRDEP